MKNNNIDFIYKLFISKSNKLIINIMLEINIGIFLIIYMKIDNFQINIKIQIYL